MLWESARRALQGKVIKSQALEGNKLVALRSRKVCRGLEHRKEAGIEAGEVGERQEWAL